MKKEDKVKIDKEVFEFITEKMRLHGISFTKDNYRFALDMFLEGINFIPNKVKEK